MTPEQTEELAALKAALKQHIKETDDNFLDFGIRNITMSPIACRIALTGIEALEELNNDRFIGVDANNDLLSILTIWKGGEA